MDTLTLLNSLSLTLSGNKRAEPERMGAWVPHLDSGVVMALIDYVGDLGQSYLTSVLSVLIFKMGDRSYRCEEVKRFVAHS